MFPYWWIINSLVISCFKILFTSSRLIIPHSTDFTWFQVKSDVDQSEHVRWNDCHFLFSLQVLHGGGPREDPPRPGGPDVCVHSQPLLQAHQCSHHHPPVPGGDRPRSTHIPHARHCHGPAQGGCHANTNSQWFIYRTQILSWTKKFNIQ